MILKNVQSNLRPELVKLENLPDGQQRVIISENISEIEQEDGILYQYDVYEFSMPNGETATVESITENLEAWERYADEDHEDPTIEDRVSILEDVVALLMEG